VFKPGDICEFVPGSRSLPYTLPIREIRDGKVCRLPPLVQARRCPIRCPIQADGAIIVFLVMKSEAKLMTTWAVLYGETLVEVYEFTLSRMRENP
jgi:hypothetical protein